MNVKLNANDFRPKPNSAWLACACRKPPKGWFCTRRRGHPGRCVLWVLEHAYVASKQ